MEGFGLETTPSVGGDEFFERHKIFKATLREPSGLSNITECFDND